MEALDRFWAHVDEARTGALDRRLEDLVTGARTANPGIELDPGSFLAYVASRFSGGELGDFLDGVDAGELYLVCACAEGDARAQARFDELYLREVKVGASRLRCSPDELDELRQKVRRMLLEPGEDGRVPVAGMTARGDLRALVRLMALRAGISMRRSRGREISSDDERLFEMAGDATSPSLLVLKDQHRRIFSQALEQAMAALEPRQRTVLRMHHLDRVPLHKLAAMYKVDRSTISRWIARARETLLSATRKELARAHGVAPDQLDSFLDVIRSSFDVSLERMLAG